MALIKRNMLLVHLSAYDHHDDQTLCNSLFNADDQHDEWVSILRDRRQIDLQDTTNSDTSHHRSCDLRDCSNDQAKATVKRLQPSKTQEHVYNHACICKCKSCILSEAQRREAELVDSTPADLTVGWVESTVLAGAAF
jgi:hypothetical protein